MSNGNDFGQNLNPLASDVPRNFRRLGGTPPWRNPYSIYDEALNDAKARFSDSTHNGVGDAYRHCLASCMMARELGALAARFFGWANEKSGDWSHNQPKGEREMDDYNNAYESTDECRQRCFDASERGNLKTYQPGTTSGYWEQP